MLARARAPGVATTGTRYRRRPSSAIVRRRPQPTLLAPLAAAPSSSSSSPPLPLLRRRRRQSRCAASANDNKGGGDKDADADDNDLAYVAKLALFSFAGAAVVKYGSQLFALPSTPSLPVALAVVLFTPALYSAWLLTRR